VPACLTQWGGDHTINEYTTCVEACNAGAVECNHCASACLQEPDVKMMARCIALDVDCAAICQLAAAAMARESEHAGCAQECRQMVAA
jgi:hypothetical protein